MSQGDFITDLNNFFKEAVAKEREKFIKKAVEEYEVELRKTLVKQSAVLLETTMNMRLNRNELVITIRNEK